MSDCVVQKPLIGGKNLKMLVRKPGNEQSLMDGSGQSSEDCSVDRNMTAKVGPTRSHEGRTFLKLRPEGSVLHSGKELIHVLPTSSDFR